MSAQGGSVRKRRDHSSPAKAKDAFATGIAAPRDPDLDAIAKASLENKSSGVEWDYRIAVTVLTVLAFITRFWGISHPNEVVFDEVHFGKVWNHTNLYSRSCADLQAISLPLTTSSEPTSSMSILRLANFFLH